MYLTNYYYNIILNIINLSNEYVMQVLVTLYYVETCEVQINLLQTEKIIRKCMNSKYYKYPLVIYTVEQTLYD